MVTVFSWKVNQSLMRHQCTVFPQCLQESLLSQFDLLPVDKLHQPLPQRR